MHELKMTDRVANNIGDWKMTDWKRRSFSLSVKYQSLGFLCPGRAFSAPPVNDYYRPILRFFYTHIGGCLPQLPSLRSQKLCTPKML